MVIAINSNAQLNNTELGFSKRFDETLIVKGYSKFITVGYPFNGSKMDTVTYNTDVFRTSNGTEDSMKSGLFLAAYNRTFNLSRTISSHYSDSSVFIDQSFSNNTWSPTYRYSVKYDANHLMLRYYSEYHQTTGWDGQMDRFEIKRSAGGQYTGYRKLSLNINTHKFVLRTESFRYYSKGLLYTDSTFDTPNTLTEVANFVYSGADLVRINVYSPTKTYDSIHWIVENNSNHKIKKMTQFYMNTTLKKIVPSRSVEYIEDTLTTGIQFVAYKENIRIYPNPVLNTCTIHIPEESQINHYQMFVFDAAGRIVKSLSLQKGYNNFERENLQNGIYLFSITSEKGIIEKGVLSLE